MTKFKNLLETEPEKNTLFKLPKWIKKKELALLLSESEGFQVI